MKILYVLDKPNLYGSELHVQKLIEGFKNEHSVGLLTFQEGPLLERVIIDKKLIKFSWLDFFSINTWRKLVLFLRQEKIDIIHAHQPKAIFFMSIIGWFLQIKTIITIHSLPITNAQSHSNRILSFAVYCGQLVIKVTSELLANKVIYLSNFSFASTFFKNKSIVIPNWISHEVGDFSPKHISPNDKIKFLTVGSISYNKGFDRLIETLNAYSNTNWELHVVGEVDPLFQKQFDQILSDFRLKDQITLHGYQTDVSNFYSTCDIFILLSRSETFGLVYIEAMSYGMPIIAWDIPVIHEIVPKGNLVIRAINDINKLDSSILQGKIEELSLVNFEHVRMQYSSSTILARYNQLYNSI